jgi:hypothetical protein
VEFHFEFVAGRRDYALAASDQNVLEQANLNPDRVRVTGRPPNIRFKDLEAVVVARVFRDQVKFSQRIEFAAATHATTFARIEIQIPCESCTHEGRVVPSAAYPLFIRISKPSGRVVDTPEIAADIAVHDRLYSGLVLAGHLEVPLTPGTYQLAIATKNASTGEVGSLRTQLEVPAYESLGMKN